MGAEVGLTVALAWCALYHKKLEYIRIKKRLGGAKELSNKIRWRSCQTEAARRDCYARGDRHLPPNMLTRLLSRGLRATAEASCVVRIPNAHIYRFGDSDKARPVLRAVDWTVREGESWAVVGSGAGEKTTLLEVSTHHCLQPVSTFFVPPLNMPVIYGRRVDPPWEHADIPPSTWRSSPIALAQAAYHQRGSMLRLIRTSTACLGRCILRLYCAVRRGSRWRSCHSATKHVSRRIRHHTGLYKVLPRGQVTSRATGRVPSIRSKGTEVRRVDREIGTHAPPRSSPGRPEQRADTKGKNSESALGTARHPSS